MLLWNYIYKLCVFELVVENWYFVNLELEEYEEAMDAMFRDGELMYGNMTRDLYFLGQVLDKKYRYLTNSYNIFMVGFVATVLIFSYITNDNSTIPISQSQFIQMAKSNDVRSVKLLSEQKKVYVTLKPEALANSKYALELKERSPIKMLGRLVYGTKLLLSSIFGETIQIR